MRQGWKKWISLLLAVVMLLGTAPLDAYANEGSEEPSVPENREGQVLLCRFICEETVAEVWVYTPDGSLVYTWDDGLHHLTRGDYLYSASAEGFEPIVMQPFCVPAEAEGDQELHFVMHPLGEKSGEAAPPAEGNPAEGASGTGSPGIVLPKEKLVTQRAPDMPEGGIFDAHYGIYQVFDVQRSPSYPRGTQQAAEPFAVMELSEPFSMEGLREEDYFRIVGLGPASEMKVEVSKSWKAEAEELDPYAVALHLVSGEKDTELARGVIGAFTPEGFLFESGGKGIWISNTKGYYYSSTKISYTPAENGRLVCDVEMLKGCKAESMLKPAADASDHRHVWETVSKNGTASFRCTAADCPYGEEKVFTIDLVIPSLISTGGNTTASIIKSEKDADWPEELQQNVLYYVGRGKTEYSRSITPPVMPGTYTAKVSVGYRMDPRELKADFAIVDGERVVFEETKTAGDVTFTVKAEAGVFPKDAVLSVEQADLGEAEQAAVAAARGERKAYSSGSYLVRVLDQEGEVLRPVDGHAVSVTVSLSQAADKNLRIQVYHITKDEETGEPCAEAQTPGPGGSIAEVKTDGTMLFTVELSAQAGSYAVTDVETALDEVLEAAGLSGTVEKAEVSNPEILCLSEGKDGWILSAPRSFGSDEWIKVSIRGIEYRITVTDGRPGAECLRKGGHSWSYDNGIDPVVCTVCGELKFIAEGGSFDVAFDGDLWAILGDPDADAENYVDWDEMFEDMEFSRVFAEDLLKVADTQLGYQESLRNYAMSAHGARNGYTRYGAWYGMPYGEWCAMFISFCLHYAGITDEEMPYQASCPAWVEALKEREMYEAAGGVYVPRAGDLVFYDADQDGTPEHVGIVRAYNGDAGVIYTVEGNLNDCVSTREVGIQDEILFGYGLLPDGEGLAYPALSYHDVTDGMEVDIQAPAGAFPKGTTVRVTAVEEEQVLSAVEAAMEASAENSDSVLEKKVVMVKAFDISFFNEEGEEIEPLRAISVKLCPAMPEEEEQAHEVSVVHIDDEGVGTEMEDVACSGGEVAFSAGSFSTYVYTSVLVTRVLDSRGDSWRVTLTYDTDAQLPDHAVLSAEEIPADADAYAEYADRAAAALAEESRAMDAVRLFDISILADGEKIQPKATVTVNIELEEKLGDNLAVLHLGDETEIVEAEAKQTKAAEPKADEGRRSRLRDGDVPSVGVTLSFQAEGFSVYAIVEAPGLDDLPPTGWAPIQSAAELRQYGTAGIYIRHALGYYFTDEYQLVPNTTNRYGIVKTAKWTGDPSATASGAALYYFESVPETTNQFRVYCVKYGVRHYVKFAGGTGSLMLTETYDESDTAYIFSLQDHKDPGDSENVFAVRCGTNQQFWNMRGGVTNPDNNHEFCIYAGTSSVAGDADPAARIQLLYYATPQEDPYDLDGAHYGLVRYDADYNTNTKAKGLAMMAQSNTNGSLVGKVVDGKMEYLDFFDDYFVAQNAEITMWGFEYVPTEAGNNYRLYIGSGDSKQYLAFTNTGTGTNGHYRLALLDAPGANVETDPTLLTLNGGTGDKAGMIQLLFTNTPAASSPRYLYNRVTNQSTPTGEFTSYKTTNANDANTWFYLATPTDLSDGAFDPYSATKISVSDDSLSAPYDEDHPKPKVIVYTRVWDEEINRYKFFAIDKDGNLVRCYDGGGEIFWYDVDPENLMWEFTEYLGSDGKPSWYYELESVYCQNPDHGEDAEYLAPQITGSQTLSGRTIGVNMNGRRYGDYFSKIIAWDNGKYAYAGLLANTETNTLEAVPMSLSSDWYFAIVNEAGETPGVVKLSVTETVDNTAYGITMRMFDYNNPNGPGQSTQDTWQTTVMGGYQQGGQDPVFNLVTRNLAENGYPTATHATQGEYHSLIDLFPAATTNYVQKAQDANHLFIQQTYDESGYFEFDSTQNYAYFDESAGDFIVYDQIGGFERTNSKPSDTIKHGQFNPYNSIDSNGDLIADNGYIPDKTDPTWSQRNWFGIHGTIEPLGPLNPRYGEGIVKNGNQTTTDWHFGMEMTATFMQSPDGKDDWGHDIIFEFSGDDDFWLYVDGVLVLDIGGTHMASDGWVNFATGQVYNQAMKSNTAGTNGIYDNNGYTTLKKLFKEAYRELHGTYDGVDTYLDGIFDGEVFKNYTSHSMKVLYMERGANASNLHMRFNLAPVKAGSVELEKHVKGTDKQSYASARFPYQIFWRVPGETGWTPVTVAEQAETVPAAHGVKVFYKNSGEPVDCAEYYPSDTNRLYENVFFLMPEQHAVIEFHSVNVDGNDISPEDIEYYIQECYINPNIYELVEANEVALTGNANYEIPAEDSRFNYRVAPMTVEDRKLVSYVNHVNPNALRTLTVTKILHGREGVLQSTDPNAAKYDPAPFRFRLYLGEELGPYATDYYYVKNPDGYYCYRGEGEWVPITRRTKDFNQLTDAEKEAIAIQTGPWGTAADIQAGYSVEIRGLLPETKFMVKEQANDLPLGYDLGFTPDANNHYEGEGGPPERTLIDYERVHENDSLQDSATYDLLEDRVYNTGQIIESLDAEVRVHNRKGWGLSIQKTWSDAAFMDSHDDIYFAIYYKPADGGALKLKPGFIRRMKNGETYLSYFLDELIDGVDFKTGTAGNWVPNYMLFEVQLNPIPTDDKFDADGYLIDPGPTYVYTPTRIEDGVLHSVGGQQILQGHNTFTYKASYGDVTWNSTGNAASFSVTNNRPGVRIIKRDWEDKALLDAEFTLKQGEAFYGSESYVSGDYGLVTIAYFATDQEYTLKEESAPSGFVPLPEPVNIKVDANNVVTVESAEDPSGITIVYKDQGQTPTEEELKAADVIVDRTTVTDTMIATIIVRDREAGMQLKKLSSAGNTPLAGVHFQLFARQSNGSYTPIAGKMDLVTDENGMLSTSDFAGLSNKNRTYKLVEKEPYPDGHAPLAESGIIFTLKEDGTVTLAEPVLDGVSLIPPAAGDESKVYTLQVVNTALMWDFQFIKLGQTPPLPTGSAAATYAVLPGVTFQLFTDEACTTAAKDFEGQDLIAVSGQNGVVCFEEICFAESGDTIYYMKETSLGEANAPVYWDNTTVYKVTYGSDGTVAITEVESTKLDYTGKLEKDAEGYTGYTIKNNLVHCQIIVEKLDHQDLTASPSKTTPIEGAKFDLYKVKPTTVSPGEGGGTTDVPGTGESAEGTETTGSREAPGVTDDSGTDGDGSGEGGGSNEGSGTTVVPDIGTSGDAHTLPNMTWITANCTQLNVVPGTDPDDPPTTVPLVTGTDGKIDLGDLLPGTYYLVETEAPTEYYKLNDPIELVVAKDPTKDPSEYTVTVKYNITVINGDKFTPTGYTKTWPFTPGTAPSVTVFITDQPKYGSLEIIKDLPEYEDSEQASFTFNVVGKIGTKEVYSNVVTLTLNGPGSTSEVLDHIPAGATVTVTEINTGAHYVVTPPVSVTQNTVIVAKDIVSLTFKNTYTPHVNGGHGVENHYEPDEQATQGWSWKKATPAAADVTGSTTVPVSSETA